MKWIWICSMCQRLVSTGYYNTWLPWYRFEIIINNHSFRKGFRFYDWLLIYLIRAIDFRLECNLTYGRALMNVFEPPKKMPFTIHEWLKTYYYESMANRSQDYVWVWSLSGVKMENTQRRLLSVVVKRLLHYVIR